MSEWQIENKERAHPEVEVIAKSSSRLRLTKLSDFSKTLTDPRKWKEPEEN